MKDIPTTSAPGAWQRGAELRASAGAPTIPVRSGHHDHDGMDGDGDGHDGPHIHHELHARLDGHDGQLDEHHQRLLNLEKAAQS